MTAWTCQACRRQFRAVNMAEPDLCLECAGKTDEPAGPAGPDTLEEARGER